jgi:hypothetical protein
MQKTTSTNIDLTKYLKKSNIERLSGNREPFCFMTPKEASYQTLTTQGYLTFEMEQTILYVVASKFIKIKVYYVDLHNNMLFP